MRIFIWLAIALLAFGVAPKSFAQQDSLPTKILGVSDSSKIGVSDWSQVAVPNIGVGERLVIKVDGTSNPDPAAYMLFLDGRPVEGLDDAVFDAPAHAFVFRLMRTTANEPVWKSLLGAPSSLSIPVTVSLGKKTPTPVTQTIFGDGKNDTMNLTVVSLWRFLGAAIPIILVIFFVLFCTKRTTLLKDNQLPQIDPARQPFSLGRCQMAFWFILVFASFVSLYALLWDYQGIISTQSLWLMGISGTTGIGAITIDVIKDSPADAANRALRALGLNAYTDVEQVRLDIADRKKQLAANPAPDVAAKLTLEIQDRNLLLRAYDDRIKPFLSEGWFRDMTTDQNGTSLARLQTFCWTCILGVVFVIGVYTDLALPQFDTNLLLLMGISGAGYLGFKYPEPEQ